MLVFWCDAPLAGKTQADKPVPGAVFLLKVAQQSIIVGKFVEHLGISPAELLHHRLDDYC
ncbi:hypothetical protein CD932_09990 [Janthinobacterium sp. PC23-8]|nr:hypothetical protein CD932_09990 [Janthinobacterium sp. PC23-8]